MFQKSVELDTLYSSTWDALLQKGVVDNIYKKTPFTFWLLNKGRMVDIAGGKTITFRLMYGENSTVTTIGGRGDQVPITRDEITTMGEVQWKYIVGSVPRYFADDQQNSGTYAIADMVADDLMNLRKALEKKLETYLTIGDGSGNSGRDPDGLVAWINKTPTNKVGGVDGATNVWWRSVTKQASGAATLTLLKDMRNLINTCGQGKDVTDTPDLGLTSQKVFELFQDEMMEFYRIPPTNENIPFPNVTFGGMTLMWSPSLTALEDEIRVINSSYLKWVRDPRYHFKMTDWKVIPGQFEDRVAQTVVAGNLVCTNRSTQGVLHGIRE